MPHHQPFSVIAFHSCERNVGLDVINGRSELKPSNNKWDWLGPGIYFWEQNPKRAFTYAEESSQGKQFNKFPIKTPFVIGAIIDLGNSLNLVESESLQILSTAYQELNKLIKTSDLVLPVNNGNNRALDCAVIKYIHQSNKEKSLPPYDTIRCAFQEGTEVYPGATISSRLHIQICVLNPTMIKGYFLPRPLKEFNPFL